jgi:hypothetical protein
VEYSLTRCFFDDSLKPHLLDTPLLDTDQARTHPLLPLSPPAESLDFLDSAPLTPPAESLVFLDSAETPLLLRLSMLRLLDSPGLGMPLDKWEVTHHSGRLSLVPQLRPLRHPHQLLCFPVSAMPLDKWEATPQSLPRRGKTPSGFLEHLV